MTALHILETSDHPSDRLGRGVGDLRISVIDRCNFRCTFCMPRDREYHFLPRKELLTFEELRRLAALFVRLGVRKIRLTGGEPLLRTDIEHLVEMLAELPGVEDLALTTNGLLLAEKARALRSAGLSRVTVSLESLRDDVFARINGVGHPVSAVLSGIDEAEQVGLGPIKVNVVVMRGVNDDEVVDIARFFKGRRQIVRFIEYMDVGTVNNWNLEQVLSAREILARVAAELAMEEIPRERPSDVALRFKYLDDGVEVGAIASVTEPFCGDCARARLTSEGRLFTCLFGAGGVDLKAPLRAGSSDEQLEDLIRQRWLRRDDRYSEERSSRLREGAAPPVLPKVEMFRIGG